MDTVLSRRDATKIGTFLLMDYSYANGLLIFFQTSVKIPVGFVKQEDNPHIFRDDLDYSQQLEHCYFVLVARLETSFQHPKECGCTEGFKIKHQRFFYLHREEGFSSSKAP